jgi:hypothetical protein
MYIITNHNLYNIDSILVLYGAKWLVSHPVPIKVIWRISEMHIFVCICMYRARVHVTLYSQFLQWEVVSTLPNPHAGGPPLSAVHDCLFFVFRATLHIGENYILRSLMICIPHPVATVVAQWLRYCATNQKVAGLIPDGVMEFFIDINPSDLTKALGSTQPLTEMGTGSISWG